MAMELISSSVSGSFSGQCQFSDAQPRQQTVCEVTLGQDCMPGIAGLVMAIR